LVAMAYIGVGESFYDISNIIEDLKHSWYFRIWTGLAFVAVVFGFVALIILGSRQNGPFLRDYVIKSEKILFPPFSLSYAGEQSNFTFSAVDCKFNNDSIKQTNCTTEGNETCLQFTPDVYAVVNKKETYALKCNLGFEQAEQGDMIAYQINGLKELADYGEEEVYVSIGQRAWIYLHLTVFWKSDQPTVEYTRNLVYHGATADLTSMELEVHISSFKTFNYVEATWYDGWSSNAAIGGFWCFIYFFFYLCMIGVGFVFGNNSRFLRGGSVKRAHDEHYQPIAPQTAQRTAGENAPLVSAAPVAAEPIVPLDQSEQPSEPAKKSSTTAPQNQTSPDFNQL